MNTTTNTTSNNIKMILVLVMLLLSSVGFAQNTIEVPATVATTTTATEANTSMNMVSWFMGTKQTTNENITKESNSKKQMMTSGIAPNRLLIKTFLKKASQYASNIAQFYFNIVRLTQERPPSSREAFRLKSQMPKLSKMLLLINYCDYNLKGLGGYDFAKPLVFVDDEYEGAQLSMVQSDVNSIIENYKANQGVAQVSVYLKDFNVNDSRYLLVIKEIDAR